MAGGRSGSRGLACRPGVLPRTLQPCRQRPPGVSGRLPGRVAARFLHQGNQLLHALKIVGGGVGRFRTGSGLMLGIPPEHGRASLGSWEPNLPSALAWTGKKSLSNPQPPIRRRPKEHPQKEPLPCMLLEPAVTFRGAPVSYVQQRIS